MAKNTNRVASLIAYVAALGLATGAWAAHWEIYANNPVVYAAEVFGGDDPAAGGVTLMEDDAATTDDAGTQIIENDEQTNVDVILYLPNDASVTVGPNSEIEVTFTLTGATFGQAVSWTDIQTFGADLIKVGGSQQDGRRNDNSVGLKVKYTGSGAITVADESGNADFMKTAITANYGVRLGIGSLNGYSGAGAVNVDAEFRVTDGPDNNFPDELVARKAVAAVPAVTDDPTTTGTDETAAAIPAVRGTSGMIASSKKAVTFMGANGDTGNIDLENRAKLAAPQTQVAVGSISSMDDAGPVEKDGTTSFATGKGAEADIHITVTGMVRDTDTVYFDIPSDDGKGGMALNGKMDAKEGLTIEDGVATGTFRRNDGTVYFVPDGETAMTSGKLTAMFAVEYDATSVVDPKAVMGGGNLVYNGVEMQARAYAIPPLSHMDDGNVRLKCEATGDAMCTVFLDCNEQNGMARFGELGDTIAAGATAHLTEEDIADVLGIDDWTGRLSCDVLSANSVSVQVLVRSGESLINNTYVDHP